MGEDEGEAGQQRREDAHAGISDRHVCWPARVVESPVHIDLLDLPHPSP